MLPKLPPMLISSEIVAPKHKSPKTNKNIHGIGARSHDFNSNVKNVLNILSWLIGVKVKNTEGSSYPTILEKNTSSKSGATAAKPSSGFSSLKT